jgi:hypothetical protein
MSEHQQTPPPAPNHQPTRTPRPPNNALLAIPWIAVGALWLLHIPPDNLTLVNIAVVVSSSFIMSREGTPLLAGLLFWLIFYPIHNFRRHWWFGLAALFAMAALIGSEVYLYPPGNK